MRTVNRGMRTNNELQHMLGRSTASDLMPQIPRFFIIGWIVSALFSLLLTGGLIWIVLHFVFKWW